MHDSLKQQLTDVGLSEYEAGVYVELTERSPSSAAALAKKLKLSRSTVYTAIERLVAKGLVGTSYRNEVKQFVASPPSAVADLLRTEERDLKRRMGVFENLTEHLRMLAKGEQGLPNIIFFEGQESLKKIYLSMLREAPKGATMRILRDEFVWGKDWAFVFGDDWNGRVRRLRAEQDVRTKLLVNDSAEERSHAKYYRARKHLEARLLPKSQPVRDFAIYVLGDTASILSMEKDNLVGIRITNRHIADNFARVFDVMWAAGKAAGKA